MTDLASADIARVQPLSYPAPLSASKDYSAAIYGWASATTCVILIRVLVFATGFWSLNAVTTPAQLDWNNASGTPWVAFDSGFYRSILIHGYPPGPAIPYQIAYFPLYPAVARLFWPTLSPSEALIAVSNTCSIIALLITYGWAKSITNARTAFFSTMLLACYPGAVFYCASLTEGMFAMFVAIVVFLLTKQRLWTAACVCAVATACRPTAVALSVTLFVWTILNSKDVPWPARVRKVILIGMISVIGGACYQGFMWHRYHRFDAYKIAEDKWETLQAAQPPATDAQALREVRTEWLASSVLHPVVEDQAVYHAGSIPMTPPPPPEPKRYSLQFFESRLRTSQAWNRVITVILMLVLVGAVVRRSAVPRSLLLVPLIIFLMSYLPNFGLRASSILRYESAGIPLFVVLGYHLAKPKRQPLFAAVILFSIGMELYYAFLFSRGSWVG